MSNILFSFWQRQRFSLAAASQKQKGILISIRNGIFFETESFNSLFFSLRVKILPPLLRRQLLSFMGEKFTQLLIYLFCALLSFYCRLLGWLFLSTFRHPSLPNWFLVSLPLSNTPTFSLSLTLSLSYTRTHSLFLPLISCEALMSDDLARFTYHWCLRVSYLCLLRKLLEGRDRVNIFRKVHFS